MQYLHFYEKCLSQKFSAKYLGKNIHNAFWHKMMAYLSKEIHPGPLLHIKHKCFATVTEAINKALEMSSRKENSMPEEGGSVSYTMYVKVKYTW